MVASKPLPSSLAWLADAPLFIDADQVARFYDAVVRPDATTGTTTLLVTKEKAGEMGAKLGLGAQVSPNELLKRLTTFLPFLDVEGKLDAEVTGRGSASKTTSRQVQLHPIDTPQRQLEQLTLHYLVNLPKRLFFQDNPGEAEWRDASTIAAAPRALVFLDLPPGVKLIPTAAEFDKKIDLIYDRLKSRDGQESLPTYPDLEKYPNPQERQQQLKQYWQWFQERFSSTRAMVAIEKAAEESGSRIHWIDYRLPVNDSGDTVHLHVVPGGKYDTGVFAYNFVKRGFKHGIRLVGTLKTEPDINVLAIYDK
jgi:hypothetical protein